MIDENIQKQPPEVFYKKGVLRNFAEIYKFWNLQGNFIEKESLAQAFSCQFCKISKNTVFAEHLWTTASKYCKGGTTTQQLIEKSNWNDNWTKTKFLWWS